MSLILEALRKSEAERQRGRAPGLFVEQQSRPRRHAQVPAWLVWVAGATLLLVLLAWGWRESVRRGDTADSAAAVTDAAPAAPAAGASAPDRLPTPAEPPAATAATAEPIVVVPIHEAEPVATVDTASASTSVPAAVAPAPIAATAAPPVAPVVAPEPTTPADAAVATTIADAPPSGTSAPTEPAIAAAAPADEPALPRLADLPAGERAALPPLKLSMHVYSDEPGRRFVIVDGQRLTEGATPAAGIVVEQIRRDGAVLSINGQRVLVSRP